MARTLPIALLILGLPVPWAAAPASCQAIGNPVRPLRGTDPACNPPCQGVVCGWADDCFCSVCPPRQACLDGACRPMPTTTDSHEPNETPESARDIAFSAAVNALLIREGAIDGPDDRDWFQIRTETPFPTAPCLLVSLTWDAQDRDLELAVCVRCHTGDPGPVLPDGATDLVDLDAPYPATRCLASMRPWGLEERIQWSPQCTTPSATRPPDEVWIVVWPATARDDWTPYRLTVRTGEVSERTESTEQSSAPVPRSTSIAPPGDT